MNGFTLFAFKAFRSLALASSIFLSCRQPATYLYCAEKGGAGWGNKLQTIALYTENDCLMVFPAEARFVVFITN